MFTDFYQNFDNISDNLCPSVEPGRLLKQSLRGKGGGLVKESTLTPEQDPIFVMEVSIVGRKINEARYAPGS